MSSGYDYVAAKKHEEEVMNAISQHPMDTVVAPIQVAPHVYYAGNKWVGVFFIDTGDGLILLDTGVASQYPIIMDGIRSFGFDPKDVKKVLLSHAHYDHCGSMSKVLEYTKAKSYVSKLDAVFLDDTTALLTHGNEYSPFDPDYYYEDLEVISQGRISIKPVVIGAHTPGTTCFFFTDVDEETGTEYKIAVHGGLGYVFLHTAEDPLAAIEDYRKAQKTVYDCPVDIALSFHAYNLKILEKVAEGGWKNLIDQNAWKAMLDDRLGKISDIEKEFI